jgi:hypothetical protein
MKENTILYLGVITAIAGVGYLIYKQNQTQSQQPSGPQSPAWGSGGGTAERGGSVSTGANNVVNTLAPSNTSPQQNLNQKIASKQVVEPVQTATAQPAARVPAGEPVQYESTYFSNKFNQQVRGLFGY